MAVLYYGDLQLRRLPGGGCVVSTCIVVVCVLFIFLSDLMFYFCTQHKVNDCCTETSRS